MIVAYTIFGEALDYLGVASSTYSSEGVCLKIDLLILFSTSNSVTLSAKPSDTLLYLSLELGETAITNGVVTEIETFYVPNAVFA